MQQRKAKKKEFENNYKELSSIIQQDMKKLKRKVKDASKLNGQQKISTIDKITRTDVRSVRNLIGALETAIYEQEEDEEFGSSAPIKELHENYLKQLQKIEKDIDFFRTDRIRDDDLYKERGIAATNTRQQYAQKIEAAQKESQDAVKNMLRMLYQTKQISNSVNLALQEQLNQLDSMNQTLRDTESTMQRAVRHISYFARAVYTDKLLMALMVLIILAVIAVIVLSAIGKIPKPTTDTLN